uniref:Uncharacterized protein n=1 Tax=Marseillevirus LCMAC103 TaxID=2506604 RepID=A0A481YUR9_9VIRU|nr:MAG: hypothetical protein LCMAC103_02720 [Marseillevirus LCMAC103]
MSTTSRRDDGPWCPAWGSEKNILYAACCLLGAYCLTAEAPYVVITWAAHLTIAQYAVLFGVADRYAKDREWELGAFLTALFDHALSVAAWGYVAAATWTLFAPSTLLVAAAFAQLAHRPSGPLAQLDQINRQLVYWGAAAGAQILVPSAPTSPIAACTILLVLARAAGLCVDTNGAEPCLCFFRAEGKKVGALDFRLLSGREQLTPRTTS